MQKKNSTKIGKDLNVLSISAPGNKKPRFNVHFHVFYFIHLLFLQENLNL